MIANMILVSTHHYAPSINRYPVFRRSFTSTATSTVISNVKCSKDLDQVVTIPEFDDYDKYNIAIINDVYYGIDAVTHNTLQKSSLDLHISALGATTFLSNNIGVQGWFTRKPSFTLGHSENIGSSVEEEIRTISLPKLPTYNDAQLYWCEIVLKCALPTTADGTKTQGGIHRYGFFTSSYSDLDAFPVDPAYPTLAEIMSCQNLKIVADDIVDISISVRCPFVYRISSNVVECQNNNNTYALPNYYIAKFSAANYRTVYNLSDDWDTAPKSVGEQDLTISMGSIQTPKFNTYRLYLRNFNDQTIMEIPKDLLEQASPGTFNFELSVKIHTYSDVSGIFTSIKIGTTVNTFPEGKIPWSGTAWESYKAYSLDYDRQMMAEDTRYARERIVTDAIQTGVSGAGLGMLSMNPAVALVSGIGGAVGGAITAGVDAEQKAGHARNQQNIKESSMKVQPGTVFQPGYGLTYVILNSVKTMHILITRFKESMAVDNIGYPCSVNSSLAPAILENGMYMIKYATPDIDGINHLLAERMAQEFARGIILRKVKFDFIPE